MKHTLLGDWLPFEEEPSDHGNLVAARVVSRFATATSLAEDADRDHVRTWIAEWLLERLRLQPDLVDAPATAAFLALRHAPQGTPNGRTSSDDVVRLFGVASPPAIREAWGETTAGKLVAIVCSEVGVSWPSDLQDPGGVVAHDPMFAGEPLPEFDQLLERTATRLKEHEDIREVNLARRFRNLDLTGMDSVTAARISLALSASIRDLVADSADATDRSRWSAWLISLAAGRDQ